MAIDPSAVWDFAKEVVGAARRDSGRTLATVTRIDADGTTWVTTGDGGEAPAGSAAAGVSVGDTVTLEWDGAAMGIRSNVSNPAPAGSVVRRAVARAQGVADAAQRVADAVNQHFFADTSGIHVTEATQEEWDTSHSGANVLINSVGQLFRDGLNNLLTLTTENGARALTIWDGLGNAAANVRAVFGENIVLGGAGGSHMVQTGTSTTFYGSDGELEVAKLETESSGNSASASLTMAENVTISAGSAGSMVIESVGADSDNGDMSLSASYGHRSSNLRLSVSDTFEPEDEYGNATFTFYDDTGEVIKRVILNGDGSIRSDGQIISYRTVTGKYQVIAENDTSGRSIALESSSAGNIGLYDNDNMRWILWKDSTDLLTIYGLADNFAVTTTAVTSTTAIAGGGYLSSSASVSKTGWTPIGVVGWNSSTRYAVTVRAYMYESYVDSGTVNWMVYNAGTSSITPTVSVYVLWARS